MWEVANGHEVYRFQGHAKGVWAVACSRDTRFVVSGSNDHTLRLWNLPLFLRTIPVVLTRDGAA